MRKFALVAAAAAFFAWPAVAQEHTDGVRTNALFERLKPLVGAWEGKAGEMKVKTEFAMAAGGSAMVETLMPESARMIDVIHPDGKDAVMFTHYCAGANQPRMRATSFDGNKITFKFIDGTNIGKSYMSGVTLTLVDADHLVQEWQSTEGEKVTSMRFEYARVK